MPTIPELLSAELGQKLSYIENVIALLDEGNTVPFIARNRKELHGAMDDTTLRTLETQFYPDSVNHPEWKQPFFQAGQRYHSETVYRFWAE